MTKKEREKKQLLKQMGIKAERGRIWTTRPAVFVDHRRDKKNRRTEGKKICRDY